jgi:acetyl esterase/lipase
MRISAGRIGLAAAMAAGVAVVAAGAAAIAARLTPWPSAMLIRALFDRGARKTSAALEKHVPSGLSEVLDEEYAVGDPDGRLDVFRPAGASGPLPTVVWIHGGGFVSGSKRDIANYLRILAAQGFTTVGVDYSIAPESRYPTPVRQVTQALAHVVRHADRLGVDPARIVLAGDSAGAQIAAQVTALAGEPAYAARVGITPPVDADPLRGALLFCGAYDFELAEGSPPAGAWLVRTALWSYSGRRDLLADEQIRLASIAHHIPTTFPPTFVASGNGDPLLPHSTGLVATLERLGIEHDTLFFPEDHHPAVGHEFQFDLDSDSGRVAFDRAVAFLRRVTA